MPKTKKIKKEVEVEVEVEEIPVDEIPVVDNTEDRQELAKLKEIANELAVRNIVVDSRLQILIEQLEKKLS